MKYPLNLRVLHWLMAVLIIGLIGVGFYMSNLPQDAANKFDMYPTHKAIGFIVMMLLVIRVIVRIKGPIPNSMAGLNYWEVKLSHWVHSLLYISMFSMVVSGYFMNSTFAYAKGINIFGLFTVPDITTKSELWNMVMHTIHSNSAYVLCGTLLLHIAGVVKHRYFDGKENDVLSRMI